MISSFSVSVSGLTAAGKRVGVAANNIANQNSTSTNVNGTKVDKPYHAQVAQSVSNGGGGVNVVVKDANPPTITTFDPSSSNADANGQAEIPNVDVAEQLVNQQVASYDFKANLKAIKVQDNLFKSLLDIKS
jgi:flagellar basal-body rod protein FlgC